MEGAVSVVQSEWLLVGVVTFQAGLHLCVFWVMNARQKASGESGESARTRARGLGSSARQSPGAGGSFLNPERTEQRPARGKRVWKMFSSARSPVSADGMWLGLQWSLGSCGSRGEETP